GRDALTEALVVNVGDVVNAQAALAVGDVGVFAARLNAEGFVIRGVFVRLGQTVLTLDVLGVLIGVGQLVQARPDDGLRLAPLSHRHPRDAPLARRDPGESPGGAYEVAPL